MADLESEDKIKIEQVVADLEGCLDIVTPMFDEKAETVEQRVCFPAYFFGFFYASCGERGLPVDEFLSLYSLAICDWLDIEFDQTRDFTDACVYFGMTAIGKSPWSEARQAGDAAYSHFRKNAPEKVIASFKYVIDAAPAIDAKSAPDDSPAAVIAEAFA